MMMNLKIAKMILGLDKAIDADQVNRAVSQKLRDQSNRHNAAAKQAIIDARDFIFSARFEEEYSLQSFPCEALGWFRQDKTQYCSVTENKSYLVTEFINYEGKVLFSDFPRCSNVVLPDHVLLIPEVPEGSAHSECVQHTQSSKLNSTPHTGFKRPVGDRIADFRILTASSKEYLSFDEYLQSSKIGHHCPHCSASRVFHCHCGAVSCDDSKRASVKCPSCHDNFVRSDIQSISTLPRQKNKQKKIGQAYKHLSHPKLQIANRGRG